ncbi:hypothetical protein Tco_0645975 [Tanacetum coccineum]
MSQTRYSVVDDETMQWLKDIVTKRLIEELEKLMNEMVNMGMTANHRVVVKTGMQNISKFGAISSNNSWRSGFGALQRALLLRFGNIKNKQFLSDNVKDSSCGLHVIGNVSDFLVNDSHYDVNLEKNEGAHKMFDEISSKGKGFEVYDAYVKESIEVGNKIVDNVVIETAKAEVEVENEVVDDDKVGDDIKVKTSKSVYSKFMVMEVNIFMTYKNISKLRPHNNNGSLVRRITVFHLLEMYVDKGYVEGWEDEDKDLNVFDYDCEVYDVSTKAPLGEKEFFVNKK